MDTNMIDPTSQLLTLIKYRELSKNSINHSEIVKNKEIIDLCVSVLHSSDNEILKTSLDTLLLLSDSQLGVDEILSTCKITEVLNALKIREGLDLILKEKSIKLLEKLKESSSESLNEKNLNVKQPNQPIKKKVFMLHIHGLHLETRKELEDTLMKKIKGIHSIIVDVEHQRCNVTVYEHVDLKAIASVLSENTDMEAKLISRNKDNKEILVPLTDSDKTLDLDQELPPYLDEKDSPVQENAVRSAKEIRIAASEWFCTAAGFLQRTFYW